MHRESNKFFKFIKSAMKPLKEEQRPDSDTLKKYRPEDGNPRPA